VIPRSSSVPEIDVDVQALTAESSGLVDRAREMRDQAQNMRDTWGTLKPVFEIEGTEEIYSKLDPTAPVIDDYVASLSSAATALQDFAITVAELQRQRVDLLTELDGARIRERNAEDNPDDPMLAVTDYESDALRDRVNALRSSFEQAEDDCAAALNAIGGGTGDGLPATSVAPVVMAGSAPVWQSQATAFSDALGDGALRTMNYLATLSKEDAAQWLLEHPDFAEAVTAVPPAPDKVAEWWASMNSGDLDEAGVPLEGVQQTALIAAIPGVIGNLNGVTYRSRNLANREALEIETTRLKNIEASLAEVSGPVNSPEARILLALNGFESHWEFEESLAAAQNINNTLPRSGTITRSLIQYTPGSPPLAAISVGNMDTASQVTVAVPGMRTTVADSMADWTGAAESLYTEQNTQMQLRELGDETSSAVVAWIGYDTPGGDDLSVLSSSKAEVGATNLVAFLEGAAAARGTKPGEDISVLAHSYGTTVSTLAAAETPVENLTLVASAGIDDSIPHVSDLKVDPSRVWTTEARQDSIANIGRGEVEAFDVNLFDVLSEHTVNPNSADYGANVFSSEDATISADGSTNGDGTQYFATEGHSISPRTENMQSGKPVNELGGYGYLDSGSTALFNSARTTLGYIQSVETTEAASPKWFDGPIPGMAPFWRTGDE
jgi:hypothetical protein